MKGFISVNFILCYHFVLRHCVDPRLAENYAFENDAKFPPASPSQVLRSHTHIPPHPDYKALDKFRASHMLGKLYHLSYISSPQLILTMNDAIPLKRKNRDHYVIKNISVSQNIEIFLITLFLQNRKKIIEFFSFSTNTG